MLWGNHISYNLSNLKEIMDQMQPTLVSDISFINSYNPIIKSNVEIFFCFPVVYDLKYCLKYQTTCRDVCSKGICCPACIKLGLA